MKSIFLSFRLPVKEKARLAALAKKTDLSVSQLLRRALALLFKAGAVK